MKNTIKHIIYLFVLIFAPISTTINAQNYFKLTSGVNSTHSVSINTSINKNTTLTPFRKALNVNALAINGQIIRNNSNYLVRIILKDKKGHEHLLLESYDEINNQPTIELNNYGEETLLLNNIQPDSLKIFIKNATLRINNLIFNSSSTNSKLNALTYTDEIEANKRKQVEAIIEKINTYNIANKKLWRAGVTPVALKDYETKKRMLGLRDNLSTGGFEYYMSGIFEVGQPQSQRKLLTMGHPYVDHFDWRNRHGKNWITSIKDQDPSGYCSAFSAVACTEALKNLYYNRIFDNNDLSEQEAACCNGTTNPDSGMTIEAPIVYIKNHGVCDETSYPFNAYDEICRSDSTTPLELVQISGYQVIDNSNISDIKNALIKHGPLCSGINSGPHHAMAIVGYGTIKEGDSIRVSNDFDGLIHINAGDSRIGLTYWIFKNSYGLHWPWTPEHQGYVYLLFYEQSHMAETCALLTPIRTTNYSDNDIICEDADGDGYYNWGIGPKPANCPSNVPDTPDGDDSNPLIGPMDQYGFTESLNPEERNTIYIRSDSTTLQSSHCYNHTVIGSNATWTIHGTINFHNGAKLTVENGASLVVSNNGLLNNVELVLEPRSKVRIENGGQIKYKTNTNFEIQNNNISFEILNGALK
ncbi:MAG: C1 family peptidase [Bacteroidaceae bacterium]|nr:C1 family peptidase [Bacteroidaceae bacterium]